MEKKINILEEKIKLFKCYSDSHYFNLEYVMNILFEDKPKARIKKINDIYE